MKANIIQSPLDDCIYLPAHLSGTVMVTFKLPPKMVSADSLVRVENESKSLVLNGLFNEDITDLSLPQGVLDAYGIEFSHDSIDLHFERTKMPVLEEVVLETDNVQVVEEYIRCNQVIIGTGAVKSFGTARVKVLLCHPYSQGLMTSSTMY